MSRRTVLHMPFVTLSVQSGSPGQPRSTARQRQPSRGARQGTRIAVPCAQSKPVALSDALQRHAGGFRSGSQYCGADISSRFQIAREEARTALTGHPPGQSGVVQSTPESAMLEGRHTREMRNQRRYYYGLAIHEYAPVQPAVHLHVGGADAFAAKQTPRARPPQGVGRPGQPGSCS